MYTKMQKFWLEDSKFKVIGQFAIEVALKKTLILLGNHVDHI